MEKNKRSRLAPATGADRYEPLLAALEDAEKKRRVAQEALAECEERYKLVIENVADPIILVDPKTLSIVDANRAFLRLTGYSRQECRKLTLAAMAADGKPLIPITDGVLAGGKRLDLPLGRLLRKDGTVAEVIASAIPVRHNAIQLLVVTFQDITDERRLQRAQERDIELAASVKQALLPPLLKDERLDFKLVYRADRAGGGDFYDYFWNGDHTRLFGFIMSDTGREIGSALQLSAFQALFRQAYEQQLPLKTAVEWLNNDHIKYFNHSFQAAILAFEFDFAAKTLTYASGGNHRFLAASRSLRGVVTLSGPLIGVAENLSFEAVAVPIQSGDAYYFLSDAMAALIDGEDTGDLADFAATVGRLLAQGAGKQRGGSLAALCFRIR